MTAMRRPIGSWKCCLLGVAICARAGCVERRMVLITEPAGAIVYDEKNDPIGAGPVDKPFTYYGKYQFRIAKDGYETQIIDQPVRAPWYEFPGLDFFSENLIPWTIRDVRYYRYALQPSQIVPPEQLLQRAQQTRDYASTIGQPLPGVIPTNPPTVLVPPVP
jgi:hypothetical protein